MNFKLLHRLKTTTDNIATNDSFNYLFLGQQTYKVYFFMQTLPEQNLFKVIY